MRTAAAAFASRHARYPAIRSKATKIVGAPGNVNTAPIVKICKLAIRPGVAGFNGLSVYLPTTAAGAQLSDYTASNYAFLADTGWRGFLGALNS